jgi:hypothetical protein
MIPFLTYPLALVALASLPALAAIYILRNRFRRRQVSSLMLWRFRVQSKEGGSRVNRLQLPLLFFLELLALFLLVTAASGPHWKLAQSARPLIVILDDSLSMQAVSGNQSSRDRALEALRKLYRFQPPPSTRLLLAGSEPRLLGASAKNWSEVEKLLGRWTCWSARDSVEPAVTLALEIGKKQANILVLTDHPPEDEHLASARLEWRSFGSPLANVAIINATRTVNGDQDRCLLEIANFSKNSQAVHLRVQTDSNSVQQSLSLGPNEQQRLVFNVPNSTPALEAALDQDSLTNDNRIQLLPPIQKRIRVQVALTNAALGELVNRALDSTGLRASISEDPQLIIHHSDTTSGSNAWSLCLASGEKPAAYTGPFIVDSSHPLSEGISLEGIIWAASAMTNPPGSVPVILVGNIPLLSVRQDLAGRQFLTMNVNAELSTLARSPDWPILFWNILNWRATQIPGLLDRNARLGAEVPLKTTGEPVTVRWPDGTVKSFPHSGDQLALETPLPGLYTMVMGSTTNSFAVNPLTAGESNLEHCDSGQWGNWSKDTEQHFEQSPLAWIFALAAVGILTAHLYLIAVGRGGS